MNRSISGSRNRQRIHGFGPLLICLVMVGLAVAARAPVLAASWSAALFYDAEACQRQLDKDPKRQKYRHHWQLCIDKFKAVYRQEPEGEFAAAGLFRAAELYLKLHRFSGMASDRSEGIDLLERVVRNFERSAYRAKAEALIGKFAKPAADIRSANKKIPKVGPPKAGSTVEKAVSPVGPQPPPVATEAPEPEKTQPSGTTITVSGLRFWSNPNYTRLVVDADGTPTYRHRLLKQDPEIGKPQRLFIDLDHSRLGKDLQRQIPINDDLLLDARAGQYDADTVRVVVDIKSFKTYKVFSLSNPFRIVIDVWGQGADAAAAAQRVPSSTLPTQPQVSDPGKLPPGALAKQLALGVRRIVIDPGHGGKDFGAPGYLKGVHEKQIVLEISKRLTEKIKKRLGCEVIMTRDTDRFLTLEERTAIANTRNADLFVSIHTNAARDRRAYGIETFFLNLATDNDAILVAARENATSEKNISDLQAILLDLMQNAKINESSRLAGYVQNALHAHLQRRYSQVRNKGVKQAPFYVLLGAQMPAVLVETSFISNERECRRLIDPKYQEQVCEGIVNGIEAYIRETNPTALLDRADGAG